MSAESRPLGITAGPDGNLWFTEGAGRIGRITPQGAITEFSTGISPGAEPTGIAAGPDGNLWFTESAGNRIGRITPTGAVTEFPLGISPGSLKSIPQGIAAGPDGNLWFTEAAGNRIGRITPQGALTWFQTGISPKSTPKGITVGPDGNLWFTERGGIGRITSSGAVTEFRTGISPQSRPSGIAPGPDGNLWFTEVYGTHIGRITPQGAVTWFRPRSVPSGITAGPDGNLWFTEALGRIGRITPQGAVTEFSAGITVRSSPAGLRSSPVGIAAGPDGNLWFTEAAGDRIGRITPQGVISEYPPTAVIGDARLRDTQAVGVPVRCPSGAARECRGTLTLLDLRGRRLGVRRFRVAPARRAEVVVPLWAAGRRRLRAQGSLQVQVVLVPSAHSTAGMVSRRAVLATAATRTTLAGSWRRLPAAPLPKGTGQLTAAWTGSSMILYGRGSHNVAAAYAPATNTWRRLSPPRGPGGAYEGTNRSVWTGTEMLVAGIPTVAYDPLTGRWRTLPRAPLTLITGLVVWTGREVIGWGGGCCGEAWNGGAAYNPATGSSRTLAASPLAARQQVTGAWTGTELVIAGGADANGHAFKGAAAYNPQSDTWRRIAPLPAPRSGAIAVWTGREVLVVGGRGAEVGFAYDPATDRWRRLPRMESGRWDTSNAAAVWTGTRLLVWGGQTVRSRGGVVAPHGLAYDPASNRWSALPLSPLRGRAGAATAVWTGRQMIVWRGVGDGAAFTPRAP